MDDLRSENTARLAGIAEILDWDSNSLVSRLVTPRVHLKISVLFVSSFSSQVSTK